MAGVEIGLPELLPVLAHPVEAIPGVEPGVMAVIEADANGVTADRLDSLDTDVLLAGDDGLLRRAVALNLRRRALDAQQLGGQPEGPAVVEVDLQQSLLALDPDFGGVVAVAESLAHGSFSLSASQGRASSTNMIGIPSRIGYANPAFSLISSWPSGSKRRGCLVKGQTSISRSLASTFR